MDKAALYRQVEEQLTALLEDVPDLVAAMASAAALLHDAFDHMFWVGFYRLAPDGSLVVGPYQGPIASTRLPPGRGVCGAAIAAGETVLVPDVHSFPGHIACDPRSKSEIVVPLRYRGELVGVLDVDSDRPDAFDETDRAGLERCATLVATAWI
ncbi:MAG: GAF domain-containing protein [Planctomycetota bacterium]|nr:GAF domain-containing protein [Planctomycetota bacterium]